MAGNKDTELQTTEEELIATRLGMTVEQYRKTINSADQAAQDKLGMSVEEFRKITMATE